MKRFLLAALFAALSTPAFAATAEKPTLKIATLDGKTFDLIAQKGKWVIVNFWATWCSPCIKEMPDISAFVAAHRDVAAIGLAWEDTDKAEIEAFAKAHPTSYPLAQVDPDDLVHNPKLRENDRPRQRLTFSCSVYSRNRQDAKNTPVITESISWVVPMPSWCMPRSRRAR